MGGQARSMCTIVYKSLLCSILKGEKEEEEKYLCSSTRREKERKREREERFVGVPLAMTGKVEHLALVYDSEKLLCMDQV